MEDLRYELENNLKKNLIQQDDAYVFGTGHIAKLYVNGLNRLDRINIKGYCVSKPTITQFNKKKVYSLDEIIDSVEHPLILVNTWQKEVYEFVFEKCGGVADVFNMDTAIFSLFSHDIMSVYDMMIDDISKETYAHIILRRMSLEMPDEKYTHGESYFSIPATRRYGNEAFVDCGAYVGDTVEQYIWKKPNFKKIIAFEPDVANYKALIKRVKRLKEEWNIPDEKILVVNAGVGKTTADYFIDGGNGTGSVISEEGEEKCAVVSLDDYLHERVDFIAADVESFEYDLMLGAESIIKKYKPTLAISIYHNAMDMFQIPLLLKNFVPEYRFAIRHNTVTFDDTILYAYSSDFCGWVQ